VNTHTNEETNQLLDIIDVFTTKSELATYLILKHLSETNVPVGSWILSDILKSRNLQVSIATIGRLLKNLDTEGYTSLAGTGGRIITPKGLEYLNMLSEKVKNEELRRSLMNAFQPQNLQELLDLYRTRKLLECETARLAAMRASDADIEAMKRTIQNHVQCVDCEADPTAPALGFHGAVAAASNVRFLIAALDVLFNEEPKMQPRILEIVKEKNRFYAEQHRLIADAIIKRDPVEAERQMRIHMESMIADLEAYIERVGMKEKVQGMKQEESVRR